MAIVDPLKKKHIPPPKTHTHTQREKKQQQQQQQQQPLSSEVVAIFLNLAVCRLDISWKSSSFWDRCVASNVSWGFFSGENLSISWSVLLNFKWLPRQYELIWLGFWYVLWRCFGFFLISFKPSTKTWALHLSQFCCLPKDLQIPGGHPNSAKSSWFRGGILEVLVKNVLNAWNLSVYGWFWNRNT